MNRTVVRSALGRGHVELGRQNQRSLSTTQWRFDDQPSSKPPATSRQRFAAAASELGSMRQSSSPGVQGVDARQLGASGPGQGGTTMINLRSLRGRFVAPRGSFGAAGGSNSQRTWGRGGSSRGGAGTFRGRGARGGGRSRGGRGRGRGRGRGGRGARDREDGKEDAKEESNPPWTAEEQTWFNNIEQGVVTKYTPSVTLESLSGYGPALATDASLGKVESVMRSMRILGGGKPFHADGYYNDPKENVQRYAHEKKPVFFDDLKERNWLGKSQNVWIDQPLENTKTAIMQAAVQGKYSGPEFAPLNDTMAVLESYHARDATYTPTNGKDFDEKVRSLLPAQGAGAKTAASRRKSVA